MKSYSLKSLGNKKDYITIVSEKEDGFVIRIVRDQDGYEDIKTAENFLTVVLEQDTLQKWIL